MPQEKTEIIPGYFYHIYNRAVEGYSLFNEGRNYDFFIAKVKKYLLPEADILAYCLMPNHYHLIVKIIDESFPRSMQKLALSYVVAYNKCYSRTGHLFQGRYQKIHIKQLKYLLDLSRYIHVNPRTAKIVVDAEDWEYSSYREYIGERRQDFVKTDIILDILCSDISSTINEQQVKYKDFVDNLPNDKEKRD
jgi:REP element-mobilizing transposase RayT